MDSRRTLYGWWFLSIALGFALLAVSQVISDGPLWGVVLRFVIAAVFAALAFSYLKTRRP